LINYYKILGVSPQAGDDEIKEGYRKMALLYNPDINKSAKAHEKFQEINEAHTTLSDPLGREKYDIVLKYGFRGIADAIAREKAPRHKDPRYKPKSAEFVADHLERRKNRVVKKDRPTLIVENILFGSMIFIGLAAMTFATMDLMVETLRDDYSEMFFFGFTIFFLVILVVGWKLVLGRKYKF